MKGKIIELRKMLPIPIGEAMEMLKANVGDVEKCIYLFKAKSIKEICEATGCDIKTANEYYEAEKFDINVAISMIRRDVYDANYMPMVGVDKATLVYVKDWLYIVESKDFGVSLMYTHLQKAIDTMLLISELKSVADMLQKAKDKYDAIFADYNDNQPLEIFVRLNKQLDDAPEFELANVQIPLQRSFIANEIGKHWRNVQ